MEAGLGGRGGGGGGGGPGGRGGEPAPRRGGEAGSDDDEEPRLRGVRVPELGRDLESEVVEELAASCAAAS